MIVNDKPFSVRFLIPLSIATTHSFCHRDSISSCPGLDGTKHWKLILLTRASLFWSSFILPIRPLQLWPTSSSSENSFLLSIHAKLPLDQVLKLYSLRSPLAMTYAVAYCWNGRKGICDGTVATGACEMDDEVLGVWCDRS